MSAPGSTVLFDVPGPRARRRIRLLTAVAAVLLAVVVALAVWQLGVRGGLDPERWGPLVDPRTEEFPLVWGRLVSGLLVTLRAAAVALVFSAIIGVLITVVRLRLGRRGRLPLVGIVELLRGLPVIVTIYYVSVLVPTLGSRLDPFWYLVIGLVAYNSVIIAEIVRAGIASLPRGQAEAGMAIGLTSGQIMRLVQLPQAVRVMLPALISQFVVVLKDTALISILIPGVDDLMGQATQMRATLQNALQMYLVVGLVYVLVNLLLDQLAQRLQRRLGRSTAAAAPDARPVQGVGQGARR